ncbi:hypothetical protein POL68_27680 [Stigmatella sp. ncwal1]|uniref:Lipoprotein n=1 Tax=Stigmatella ashevillensis TaxID=2995309 RepID=A0ABT5DFD4_9BACT|nr:hypothetical protein [Stigmatella ashevillena]MDC0712279.1 hypothetical protein [Stigmatella ashevillena]
MRQAVLLGAVALVACGGSGERRLYDNNDLQLVTAYTAKDACSCLFVAEQEESFCREWVKARPAVAHLQIDTEKKVVESSALLLWGARARFVDARTGCVLEK